MLALTPAAPPIRASGFSFAGFVRSPPEARKASGESEEPGALPLRGPDSSARKMFSGPELLLQPVAISSLFGGKGVKAGGQHGQGPFCTGGA